MKQKGRKQSTKQRKPASDVSTTNGQANSGADDRPFVREFLYLDYPKLTSYYAQLFEGWRPSAQVSGHAESTEVTRPPKVTDGFEGSVEVAAGEQFSVAQLIGLVADLNLKFSRYAEATGTEVGRTKAETIVETTELHHDIFRRVERRLREADLIETSMNTKASKRPFYQVSGPAEFLVLDDFITYVEQNDELATAMSGLGHTGLGEIENSNHLMYVLRRFYAGDINAVINADGGAASASLNPEHLQTPIEHIVSSYGRQTQIPITMLGVRAVRLDAGSNKKRTLGTYVKDLPRALLKVNDGLTSLDHEYRLRTDVHLFPLAIYVDLEVPSPTGKPR